MNLIVGKSIIALRISGYFALAAGLVFAGFSIVPFRDRAWPLFAFVLVSGLIFFIFGVAILRMAKRKERHSHDA